MKNKMTNIKKRNLLYVSGYFMITHAIYCFVIYKKTGVILGGLSLGLAILSLSVGYFKFQKQHNKNIPIVDELSIKSEILAGYHAFIFYFSSSILFNLYDAISSNYTKESVYHGKYFIEIIANNFIFIFTIILFLLLKLIYAKKGIPKKYQ